MKADRSTLRSAFIIMPENPYIHPMWTGSNSPNMGKSEHRCWSFIRRDISRQLKILKKITALREKLSAMNTELNQADKKARELADAQRTIEEYLRQEQSCGEQKRKRNDLE